MVLNAAAKPLPIKCNVATRSQLGDRLPPVPHTPPALAVKRGALSTTYEDATSNSVIRSAKDVPKRHHEPRSNINHNTEFGGTTTYSASCRSGVSTADNSFFSRVREIEKEDDAKRHGLETIPTRSGAARMQRTVDIMRKRETDADFCPPHQTYEGIDRRPLNGVPPPTTLEKVQFTYTMPTASTHIDYRPPNGLIPHNLPAEFECQRHAISDYSSSRDLFSGTTKRCTGIVPGYMAHLPNDTRNLDSLRGDKDILRQHVRSAHLLSQGPKRQVCANRPQSETVQGYLLHQAAMATAEKGLNKVAFGKKTAVLN